MYLLLGSHDDSSPVTLADIDNFRELSVQSGGLDDSAAAVRLQDSGFGRMDGDHAWLEIAALRAGGRDTEEWLLQFDGMLHYAAASGWISSDGMQVRAHLTRV